MLSKVHRKVLSAMERAALSGRFELCSKYVGVGGEESVRSVGVLAGFTYVAGGAFSQVFSSPALAGCVVKVTTSELDGYHDFVMFVQEVGPTMTPGARRFLPVILSSEVICGVRITLMERLESAVERMGYWHGDAAWRIQYAALRGSDAHDFSNARFLEPDAAAVYEALERWRRDHTDYAAWDMHPGNVMMRGDQLVVTDPWGTYAEAPRVYRSNICVDLHGRRVRDRP